MTSTYFSEEPVGEAVGAAPLMTEVLADRGFGPHYRFSEFARAGAEALGSFILVLAIILSLIFSMLSGYSWLIIALTVGLGLTAAMAAVGHVSGGGDFNPAVTLGKAIAGRTPWRDVLPYIIGQFVGALAAAAVVWAILPESFVSALQFASRGAFIATTAPGYGALSPLSQASNGQTEFGWGVALLVEILFTALFVAVVLGATRRRVRRSGTAPLVVGLSYAAFWMMTWPVARGSMNPVRAFGSVILAGDTLLWRQLWLFILGPLVGAALAGLFYRAFQPVPAVGALGRGIGSVGSDDYYTEELPYTVTDVADPVLAVDEPVDFEAIEEVPASRGARADERRRAEAVDQFVVAPDEVDEGGDRIIGSGNAEVVADILEADQES